MALIKASQTERSDRRYIAHTMEVPLLERDHEVNLAKRWLEQRDEKALHELVGAHARLVVRIAAGFRASGLPLADLIQEGNIGLMEAAERFDPTREVRFSTYASWWIVASIQNFILRNSSIVRAATTPKQRRLFFNLRRLRGRVGGGYDGGLSTDERITLANRLGVTIAEVERMETHLARPDQSLNTAIGNDESAEIQDFLADTAPTPDEIAEAESGRQARSDWIKQALDGLSPRERKIVERRFLHEGKETLADIGDSFGVSKERIRQIEARALQKMKEALTQLADRPEDLVEIVTADKDVPLEVSVHDLKRALDEGSATVVDVREPWEADTAKIAGALLIPLSEFAQRAVTLPRDKPIMIHCHHGGRSMQATQWLRRNGYPLVSNVAGGIDAWSQMIDPSVPRY